MKTNQNKRLIINLLVKLLCIALVIIVFNFIDNYKEPANVQTSPLSTETSSPEPTASGSEPEAFTLDEVPTYNGQAWVYVNNNNTYFSADDIASEKENPSAYTTFNDLDAMGRTQSAEGCLGIETMPADGEERGNISSVYPSGWKYNGKSNNKKYVDVIEDGGYVYNRCHLLMWALTGENANPKNLITGTRYLNIDGMLTWEDKVVDYIEDTENHVLYRVSPIYEGDNLVASGVLMECKSIEDDSLEFCVYCYNVQPGILINYKTGQTTSE